MQGELIAAAAMVLAALIAAGGSVMVARITKGLRRDVTAVRHHVQNSHTTNLRDDLDEKNDSVHESLAQLHTLVQHVAGQVQDVVTEQQASRQDGVLLRKDVHEVRGQVQTLTKRFDDHLAPPKGT